MSDPFGTAASARGRIPTRRSRISPDLLLGVVAEAGPGLESRTLRIDVLDRLGPDPLLSVEEGERRVRVAIAELARDMELARVPDSRAGVTAAFTSWIDHRPVTDAGAADAGIAACGWAGPDSIGWQVVVRRRTAIVAWTPSALMSARDVAATRELARGRSMGIRRDVRVAGEAAVWTCTAAPALSTAALVHPERVLRRLRELGLETGDVHLVLCPPNPFVCAPAAVARRLVEESSEPHVTMVWEGLAALGWA